MSFFENTRKPEGLGGKLMLAMMNVGHRARGLGLAVCGDCEECARAGLRLRWRREHQDDAQKVPKRRGQRRRLFARQRRKGEKGQRGRHFEWPLRHFAGERCRSHLAANQFDLVTAFETIYFWPDLLQSFREVHRVLKPDGMFLICNECGGDNEKDEKWTEKIDGMTIYKDVQLKNILEQTGFRNIQIHKSEKGWLCITAQK